MKKYVTRYALIKRITLVSLLSLIHSYSYSISSISLINFSGSVALREEQHMSNFFDKNNNTSWSDFVQLFKNEIMKLSQKMTEITRSPAADPLLGDAIDFADYIVQQFNAIIYVFEKHNGKNNISAFQNDIEALDFEQIFVVSKNKLEKIKIKAQETGNSEILESIDKLIRALEIKRKEWTRKLTQKITLLTAITKRMRIVN